MSDKRLLTPGYNIIEDEDFSHITNILNEKCQLIGQYLNQLKFKNKVQKYKNKPYSGFMGGHPVSMNKQNLQSIKKEPNNYLICEKSDGVRYMMISLSNGMSFLMGRNKVDKNTNNYFFINFENFPKSFYEVKNLKFKTEEIELTNIFDGELVRDEIRGKSHYMYLIFDTVQCGANFFVAEQSYQIRLEMARRYIETLKTLKMFDQLNGRNNNKQSFLDQKLKSFPIIEIKFKDFFLAHQMKFLLKDVIGKDGILPHGNDGLIFTKNLEAPYVNGVNRQIIKWKPPHMNTIDFSIFPNFQFEEKYGKKICELLVSYSDQKDVEATNILFDFMFVEDDLYDHIMDQIQETGQPVIAECKYDSEYSSDFMKQFLEENYNFNEEDISKLISMSVDEDAQGRNQDDNAIGTLHQSIKYRYKNSFKGNWKVDRYRFDKKYPNMLRTATSIWDSIIDNLDEDQLIKYLAPKPPPGTQPIQEKKKWKKIKFI